MVRANACTVFKLTTNLKVVGCSTERSRLLSEVGFVEVDVDVTRVYDYRELAERSGDTWDPTAVTALNATGGKVVSAFVQARKP